ncbi:MAG: ATPase AAA-2 domain protein [Candidatus Uhrbacteria bacterium GW2011_GWD2_52_7]|uniref:ATPase AAA-2 domain protein n=1 Tax=Candidatus Uhrbacteria bacterium GW2011_GWD2_52_7 TaxID=1618989 RepID=A0A0G1XIR3_9BACT|nr:MAG: ATPase AAA-2 domain protein [Candidatus Uhrbacteria bacterium GW2011_GWD2_52_7]
MLSNQQDEPIRRGFPGVLADGIFWYVDETISKESIAWRKSLKRLHAAERIVAIIAIIAGLAFFAFQVVSWGEFEKTAIMLDRSLPSSAYAGLWGALLALCFLIYRILSDRDGHKILPKLKGTPEVASVPQLEAASVRRGIFSVLSPSSVAALEGAFDIALNAKHAQVGALHLFGGVTQTQEVRVLLARLGLSLSAVADPIRRRLAALPSGETVFGTSAVELVTQACYQALATGRRTVGPLELFAVVFEAEPFLQEVFDAAKIDRQAVEDTVNWLRITDDLRLRYVEFRKAASFKPTTNMNRAYTAVATPFLDSVSEDITRDAVYGRTNFLVGREHELSTVFRAIEGGNQSVVLVGPPGVGKAAIIDGIADRMVEERVPAVLGDKRLLKLAVPLIVSAQGGSGADERFLIALHEVAASGNIVLVIENIHELVGIGAGIDLASVLASELEKGYTFVIATTTPEGYAGTLERSVLGPKLQRVAVAEPDRKDAIGVLEAQVGRIEAKHNVVFTYDALSTCVDYALRYLHDGVLPETALELARESALVASKRPPERAGLGWVRKEDVASIVGERTKIPVKDVSQDEGERLLQLESRLHERVIGQDNAVKAVASSLRRARTDLRSTNRPIANFLFLGPTGVGKTELAKATAEEFFSNESAMVRFDMSEYQEQSSVTRLIGGEAIRRAPFSLLLLDELEKAHPDILNLFLQVMDDGRLTDGLGRTVDFTNAIIIATSNAGTQFIQDEVAKGTALDAIKTELMEHQLRETYRPEFLNRFDDVIVFSPLSQDDVAAIAYLLVGKIVERLKAKGIALSVTDAAIHELAVAGFDPKFGARPLRRVVQERLENAIAEKILGQEVGRRDSLVYDAGGVLTVNKAEVL